MAEMYPSIEKKLMDWKTDVWLPNWRGGVCGKDWDLGGNRCKILHLEWVSNKILLYNMGKYI